MTAAIRSKMTYQDLLDLPEDGKRREIIGGVLFVAASPSVKHQRVLLRIYRDFFEALEVSGWGEIFLAPLDVIFSNFDVVEPDLLVVRTDRRDALTSTHVTIVPDIVLEVISPFSRRHDEVTKLALFAAYGVPEFWLADSIKRSLRGLTLPDGAYVEIPPEADGRIRSVVAPDLVLDPTRLFANLDD
jgi:Uma2 family endonuclease